MTDIALAGPARPIEYLAVLRRRKWLILLVTAFVFLVAVAAAILWPPLYRSSATILIEEPDVPDDLVRSTVSSFADERLRVIQQRVMTTQNLIGIMDKFSLYQEMRRKKPITLIVDYMRDRINLDLVSADVTDPKSGRTTRATFAFNLSFDGDDPQTTQQVANELVTLYLSENLRTRQEQATGTAGFLSGESQRLAEQIRKLEAQLADFKTKNAGSLPEEFQINTQLLDRSESQLLEVMRQAQALRERQVYLQSQLGQVDPYTPLVVNSQQVLTGDDQLRALQSQYATLSAKYGENHPDVLNLRRQIEALGSTDTGSDDRSALADQLAKLQSDLAVAKQKYGDGHPDVKRLTRQIAETKKAVAAASARTGSSARNPNNPVYIQTQAQLSAVNADLDAMKAQQQALEAKVKELETRVFATPEVERAYLNLKREYDDTVTKYQEIKSKEGQADLAQNLETERMGEKFSVIEPPELPVQPAKPNRPAIVLLGAVLAVAAGAGAGAFADSADGRIYGQRQLAEIIGTIPLAVVPYVQTKADRRRRRLIWLIAIFLLLGSIAAAMVLIQSYFIPLDVLWAKVLNQLPW